MLKQPINHTHSICTQLKICIDMGDMVNSSATYLARNLLPVRARFARADITAGRNEIYIMLCRLDTRIINATLLKRWEVSFLCPASPTFPFQMIVVAPSLISGAHFSSYSFRYHQALTRILVFNTTRGIKRIPLVGCMFFNCLTYMQKFLSGISEYIYDYMPFE